MTVSGTRKRVTSPPVNANTSDSGAADAVTVINCAAVVVIEREEVAAALVAVMDRDTLAAKLTGARRWNDEASVSVRPGSVGQVSKNDAGARFAGGEFHMRSSSDSCSSRPHTPN